jgi:hypothetical protein
VQTFSLRSGKGKVTTPDGTPQDATLDLDLSQAGPADAKPKPDAPDADPAPPPPVSTTGGATPAVSSPFSFISADQALSQFEIPPFLVPIYLAAERTYGIPWNVLASINQIETDFGRNLNVSSAGAMGWMQFMPGTWKAYGVDATGDGVADPYNPVDAIYAAARYLRASGGATNLDKAIFAYNHADWYVKRVLKGARLYGALPEGLVAETGSIAYGRFPVVGDVNYGDDFSRPRPAGWGPRGLLIRAKRGARTVATQDVRVERILLDRTLSRVLRRGGTSPRLGRAPLAPKPSVAAILLRPIQPALVAAGDVAAGLGAGPLPRTLLEMGEVAATVAATRGPSRTRQRGELPPGYATSRQPGIGVELADGLGNRYVYRNLARISARVRPEAGLRGGEAVGQLSAKRRAVLDFATVTSNGTPINPRPLVDGYRLQEVANFQHAVLPLGSNPFVPDETSVVENAPIGGSDRALAQKVLNDPGIDIYECGRQDIARGKIDRRVLGALLFLRQHKLTMRVSSLNCGHSFYTAAGGVSAHSFGAAVDISAFNGQWVLGNQGPGSHTEKAVKLLMGLQGRARPLQLISLMSFGGPSFALSDHHDHLHIGYSFDASLGMGGTGRAMGSVGFPGGGLLAAATKPTKAQELQLSRELGKIPSPRVLRKLGPGAIKVEGEDRPARSDRAELGVQPAGAGARLTAVTTPKPGQAYAVGTVEGVARRGWAKRQTVLLAFRRGAWRIVGAPRGARGRIVNPRLRAISAVAGGAGYAVGDRGAVVAFGGRGGPRALPSGTRARLDDVSARRDGKRLEAVAVGSRGVVLRLRGDAVAERATAPDKPRLTSVALGSGDALIAADGTGPDLLRFAGGEFGTVSAKFGLRPGSRVELAAVARRGGDLWVGGALTDEAGAWGRLPFVARRTGDGWRTYCAVGPKAAGVRELGTATPPVCDAELAAGTGARGAVRDIAAVRGGAVVATSAGIEAGGERFRPIDLPHSPQRTGGTTSVSTLALADDRTGWALDGAGRLARVTEGRRQAPAASRPVVRLPGAVSGGQPAPVAVALGGDRPLALSGGRLATLTGSGWKPGSGPGIGIRDAATSGDAAWAIADSGHLLGYRDRRWFVPGGWDSRLDALSAMTQVLGGGALGTASGQTLETGFNALALSSEDEGFAVGGEGAIARLDGDEWRSESTPTDRTLTGVAVSKDGAVAVGGRGTLLERRDGRWRASASAAELVGGADFTAVAALEDGTVLAAAGGAIVARRPGQERWSAAPVAASGATVRQLAGYRDRRGALHALAIVDGAGGPALLDGDASGWRPVALPAGLRLTDAAVDEDGRRVLLGGVDGHRPAVAQIALPSDGRGAGDAAATGAEPPLVASGSISLDEDSHDKTPFAEAK